MTHTYESTVSPLLWVRPQNKVENWMDFDTYVPEATRIAAAVHEALGKRRSAVELELAHYFHIISHNPQLRSIADYLFKSVMHSTMTSAMTRKEVSETLGQSVLPSTSSTQKSKRTRL
jgi:hypothetical protein